MSTVFPTHRSRAVLVGALALVLAAVLPAADAAAQTGALAGVVTDASDGQPIERAMVLVHVRPGSGDPPAPGVARTFTDAVGQYLVEGLPAGQATVVCGAAGYQHSIAEATVVDGQTTVLDLVLEPLAFGSVAGVVTDASTGLPIAGAHVMLYPDWGGPGGPGGGGGDSEMLPLRAVTGDDGAYLVDDVPTGEWAAVAWAWGYTRAEPVAVTVADGQTSTADFALEPLAFGSLEGTVTDASTGLPVEDAIVFAYQPWGPGPGTEHDRGWHRTVTGADGVYRFDQMTAGLYEVFVFRRGYDPGGGQAEVLDGQTAVLDVALVPLTFGSVGGTVSDADSGAPVAGAFVQLFPAHEKRRASERGWLSARTDDAGAYLVEDVPAGDYHVRVWAHGYQPNDPLTVTVTDGATTTADVALTPIATGSLEGTVTDADTGAPVEGAAVYAWLDWTVPGTKSDSMVYAVTGADGRYAFDDLVAGTWVLKIHTYGYHPFRELVDVVADQVTVRDVALEPHD